MNTRTDFSKTAMGETLTPLALSLHKKHLVLCDHAMFMREKPGHSQHVRIERKIAGEAVRAAADAFCAPIKALLPDRWAMSDWTLHPRQGVSDVKWAPADIGIGSGVIFSSDPERLMFFAGALVQAARSCEMRNAGDDAQLADLPLTDAPIRNYLVDGCHFPISGISPRDAIAHDIAQRPGIDVTRVSDTQASNMGTRCQTAFLSGCDYAETRTDQTRWALTPDLIDILNTLPATRYLGVNLHDISHIFCAALRLSRPDAYFYTLIRLAQKADVPENATSKRGLYLLSFLSSPPSLPYAHGLDFAYPEGGYIIRQGWCAESALLSYALEALKKGRWIHDLSDIEVREISHNTSRPSGEHDEELRIL